MSMFHELMMRKKEQIMYATIKGTLTENDGVFSGFSQSNYLITQNAFPLQPAKFEIFIKIKNTATDNNERYFVGGRLRTSFIIGITKVSANTFTFKLYGGNADGTGAGWNKTSSQITIDETQFFDVKFSYDGSEYALYVNGTKIISYLSTTRLYGNAPIYLGRWDTGSSTNVFVGEIDLPKSYIKLGSTKYNLQAVVGYTVVGSPTIVDGVVSGFSSSDYLQMPSIDFSKNFELNVELTPNSSASSATTIFGGRNAFYAGWSITAQNQIIFRLRLTDGQTTNSPILFTSNSLTANNTYVANAKRTGNIVEFKVYENGVLFSSGTYTIAEGFNWTTDLQGIFGVGVNNSGVAFDGSIDMNETYIKINGKLWFNGQQA